MVWYNDQFDQNVDTKSPQAVYDLNVNVCKTKIVVRGKIRIKIGI